MGIHIHIHTYVVLMYLVNDKDLTMTSLGIMVDKIRDIIPFYGQTIQVGELVV